MTLQASGAISLLDVAKEMGIAASGATSSPYAVALNDGPVRSLAGKASGAISLADLYGKSTAPPVTVNLPNLEGYAFSPDTCMLQLASNGVYMLTGVSSGNWITGDAASGYECYVTSSGAALTSNAGTGVWLSLGTTRAWSISTATVTQSKYATLSVQIRKIGTTTVLDTATVYLSLDSNI